MEQLGARRALMAAAVIGMLGGCGSGTQGLPSSGAVSSAPQAGSAAASAVAAGDAIGYAYVVNAHGGGPGTVSQYTMGADGILTPMAVPSVATGGNNAQLIAVDPAGRHAYVSNVSSNTIAQFTIDSTTGALRPMAETVVPVGSGPGVYYPWSIVINPSGRWAYVSIGQRQVINEYAISPDGALSPLSPATVPGGGYPSGLAIDPAGRHVYLADGRENDVYQYAIDPATGVLSPLSPATVPAGGTRGKENTWMIGVEPRGRFAYATNYFDGTVSQYRVDAATGALSPLATPTAASGGAYAESIAFDPSGLHAYISIVSATADAAVAQFAIDQTSGVLTPMSPPTVSAGGAGAAVITVDASGKYAYATSGDTGWGSTSVAQYALGADGALTLLATPTVRTGQSPWGVVTVHR